MSKNGNGKPEPMFSKKIRFNHHIIPTPSNANEPINNNKQFNFNCDSPKNLKINMSEDSLVVIQNKSDHNQEIIPYH